MRSRIKLRSEALEPRIVLDAQGVVWGADARLSLSFAPDGTNVNGAESGLFAQFDEIAPRETWQQTILGAFQVWTRETNADIGIVHDDGSDFGIQGKIRQDERFGDVRIGSIPLDEGIYAIAISADEAIDGTWTGDVLFNSEMKFESLDDVFATAVHEAGHVFGLEHSADPLSPLYPGDGSPRHVLPTDEDISNLQDIYGLRPNDLYDSLATANGADGTTDDVAVPLTAYEFTNAAQGAIPTIAYADITTPDDVDRFTFQVPEGADGTVVVHMITSGVSQLAGSLEVTNQSGDTQHTFSTKSGRDLSVVLRDVDVGEEFSVTVSSNEHSYFDVGSYTLAVWYMSVNQANFNSISDVVRSPIRYVHSNDVPNYLNREGQLFSAIGGSTADPEGGIEDLETAPGFVEGTRYQTYAGINFENDVDRFRLATPTDLLADRNWARVSLRTLQFGEEFTGKIRVLDEFLRPIESQILVSNDQMNVLQFPIDPDTEYIFEVTAANSSDSATGFFEFDAIVGWAPLERETFIQSSLRGNRDRDSFQLEVYRQQLFNFNFAVEEQQGAENAEVFIRVIDADGNTVMQLDSSAGESRTTSVFLPAGKYRLLVTSANRDAQFRDLNYSLSGASVDDPLGPRYLDPTIQAYKFRGAEMFTASVMGFLAGR